MKKSLRSPFLSFSRPSSSRLKSRGRQLFCLGLAGMGMSMASPVIAATVTMTTDDLLGTSSLNSVGHWDNLAAPVAGNEYFSGAFTVRTPADTGNTHVFAGDSLTLGNGGRLLGKSTGPQTVDFSNGEGLILDGGTLQIANATTGTASMKITGNITATSDSSLGALGAVGNDSASFETLEIAGPISGGTRLTVSGTVNGGANTGVVKLSAANPFFGVVTVAQPGNNYVASATNRLLQLNHLNALENAVLELNTTAPNGLSFAAAANTGTFKIGALAGVATQVLNDTAGNAVTLDIGGNDEETFYSGAFTGKGNIVKSGDTTFFSSGAHTYSGNTTVLAGILSIETPSLHNQSTVRISTGAKLQLLHTQTDVVKELFLNGVSQPAGVYSASTPGGYIGGTGSIQVFNGPAPAENVTMTGNDVGSVAVTSFNGDVGHWSIPGPPIAANNYFTGAFTLRTPALTVSGDGGTFAGNSLSIDAGGRFLGKAGASTVGSTVVETVTINNLILNGGALDQAGISGSNATLVVGGNITVAANSVLGAVGSFANNAAAFETLEIAATIGGSANLRVGDGYNGGANTGLVKLSSANTFSGTLTVGQPGSGYISSGTNRLLQLNNRNALQNATLNLITTAANGASFSAAANTGSFKLGAISGTANQILADTAGAAVKLDLGGNNTSTTYSGALTGLGELEKSGTGTTTLSGTNTYTGNTTVTGGTLKLDKASLSDTAAVSVAAGAFLNLTHTATDLVGSLVLNGVTQAAGTYDSANSGGRITGTGKIQVGGAATFASFMDGFAGLTTAQKAASADPDGDGISNLVEYALDGSNPTISNSLPSLTGGTITFTKRAAAVTNGDISYAIETSSTLGAAPSPWTVVVPSTNTAGAISYTLPTGQSKLFVRLRVLSN